MVLLEGTELDDRRGRVWLRPFTHQVGGHAGIMCYDKTTICKPLVSQEQVFYESLPADLRPFTAQYKGLISVYAETDSSGQLGLVAFPQNDNDSLAVQTLTTKRKHKRGRNCLSEKLLLEESHFLGKSCHDRSNGCIKVSSFSINLVQDSDTAYQMEDPNGNKNDIQERNSHNPWGLHCLRTLLSHMTSEFTENKLFRFVLLENVVSQFHQPCILDLKMGTRQHGDDATEEKKKRHMKKCEQSTSSSLGLRLGGMQVYQAKSHHFHCRDKYYGRTLTEEGFQQTLYHFLHDGHRLKKELIDPILQKLLCLKSIIERQGSYRFYSSSLLIIYEGKHQSNSNLGHQKRSPAGYSTEPPPSTMPKVDVRMIDFAHTTYKGARNNTTTYDGPDLGYIFGLQNLIHILRKIKDGD
ncbi:inositol hexakisphosphate kinase 3-like [Erpetoichthys calabaricus]|uniref:inositol hexakisphosphate kinase 3-like n=1 Tax=Erpetoichthys calabaricus TaxID=27687 RepID=UPI00109F7BDB|nr:inositol hexakisphosphate kinase 3-like [Erpetoichthys calabaricus]